MANLHDVVDYTNKLLEIDKFKDYAPNGLQVEGGEELNTIVSGVTASQALIDAAVEENADAIVVHHGYFWRSEGPSVTGIKKKRIQTLLSKNISLLAYHLPLDAHPELGNNAQLAERLGIKCEGVFTDPDLVMHGKLITPMSHQDFAQHIEKALNRTPLYIQGHDRMVQTVAWCSGGAQGYFEAVCEAGVDAYITGEVSEQNFHLAKEFGVDFIAAGHHATERYGAMSLGEHLANRFSLSHKFIDIDNPV